MKRGKVVSFMLALTALLLAGCGNAGKDASGQVLKLSASAPLDTIDISKATGYGQTGNVFESFYRLGRKGRAEPGLAKSGRVSADGLTWTFRIRNARWSNGDPITADDFVYSWRRTIDPKTASPYSYLFSGIRNADAIAAGRLDKSRLGIRALDRHTVQVRLEKPIAYFKVLLAYPLFGPQNQKVIEKYGKKYATKSKYMVYSGPFRMTGWNGTSDKWNFVKNDRYWDRDKVKLKKITYKVVENTNTGYQLYLQNKLDMTPLSNQQVRNLSGSSEFRQYPYSLVAYLAYNFQDRNPVVRKALNNRNIRLAFSLALDRKVLTKKVFGDGSSIPTGFVAGGLAYDPKTGRDFAEEQKVPGTVGHDEKKARELFERGMAEIGEKSLTVSILAANDSANNVPLTQYLQSQYTKVLPGIKVNLTSIPGKSASDRAGRGDFDIYVSGWGGDFNDPITFLQIPLSGTSYNYGKYSNPAYDALIGKAGNEDANDADKRWQDLVSAARIFNSDQGVTPVYQQTTAYMQKKHVRGIVHNTAGTQWSYKYAYIK